MIDIRRDSSPTSPPYTPTAIANSFIEHFGDQGRIHHIKLQKLVYCAYGWWLAKTSSSYGGELAANMPRLTDEGPQVWQYGPVFASMYQVFRIFGNAPIWDMQSLNPDHRPAKVHHSDKNTLQFLGWVWKRYGSFSGYKLSELTHREGTPWHRVAVENNFVVKKHTQIPDEYILEEFSQIMDGDLLAASQ